MTASGSDPAITRNGLVGRVIGVVTSPRAVYADVAARPRLAGVLLVVLAINIAATLAFFSTDVGRLALVDQLIQSMESFGRTVSDAQYERLQQVASYGGYAVAASQLVVLPLALLFVSGVIFAGFSGLLGGNVTFRQVLAVVAHSWVILALQQLFTLPLAYARESLSNPTSLAVFLPMLEEDSFPARLLGAIDLFRIWWIVSVAIGIAVLYRRRTGPIAAGLLATYGAIALVIAVAQVVLSGA